MSNAAETSLHTRLEPLESLVTRDRAATAKGIDVFLRALQSSTDVSSLGAFPAEVLAREVLQAFSAITKRERGTERVTSRTSGLGDGGTVFEIVNDDMPFLLDSVLGEIQARGLEVRLVLHPIYKSDRNPDGTLRAVTALGDINWGDGRQESYIAIHVGRLTEPRQAEIIAAMQAIVADVRRVVADWRPMRARIEQAIGELAAAGSAVPTERVGEAKAFLAWLLDNNFTLLGTRDYRLEGSPGTGNLVNDGAAAGLGILANPEVMVLRRGTELVAMTPEVRQFFFSADPLIITKANVVSRVHRRVHMDYIGVKRYGPSGEVIGELRLVGLFTSSAYTAPPDTVPVLRRKVARVTEKLDLPAESHAGKSLANVLEQFPRDELFQIATDDLERWIGGILDLELRPRTRAFLRYDRFDRFVSALLFVPRDRFSTSIRARIGDYLADAFGGYIAAFYPHFSAGPLVRVHFIVARREGALPSVSAAEVEARIARILRTWNDELDVELAAAGGPVSELAGRYLHAFPGGYADTYPASRAVADIERIETLSTSQPAAIDLRRAPGVGQGQVRAAIYCVAEPMRLSERVPLLENLGFSVIDERTWSIAPEKDGKPSVVILHDMLLETFDGRSLDDGSLDERLEATFLAVHSGKAENDAFNRLVMVAGLTWREAALLRAYAAYLRQLGSAWGPRYVAETLASNPGLVSDLIALFRLRFDPASGLGLAARLAASEPLQQRIETDLGNVASLDHDRILRLVLALIEATLRTDFYRVGADGSHPETIAFKLDGSRLAMAPAPRPYREIYVASPRVEGVHLRFAPIARGGIRWSDRAQDYRTEVLGLAKAQLVKNAVIVPSGAKGGFYPKRLSRSATRDEQQKEGVACYRIFIGAMLDLTDNIVDGATVPPADVVCHDAPDPYLVVAADKGTATFSDIANALAADHEFWLGDAFASGGSAGYDHKGLGITARGAWECVKRHFRELGRDIQKEPFRVAGVGDMSGDVFGNGMLLSPEIRLVAAFDHRDIFLDPEPDAATGFAERRRLFDLARSSWADYDRSKISAGGGIFSRALKSIPVSPAVKSVLGITADELAPADLMRAILSADIELLWFGGIGTYVRASAETDADAGDRANDAVRIAATDLRAKVVGEGANLGMTQRGRIEAASRGIRLNTDFIDNSAGVNTSDQEVNIKIALRPAVTAGRLSLADRNALLADMSGDVATAVLRNNYQQSLALSLAERRGARDLGGLSRLLRDLEARGLVNRRLEALPSDHELAERGRMGKGLTRPELAVVLSFAKIALLHELLSSAVPDDKYLSWLLADYFPPALRQRFAADIAAHRLRREIVATTLTNGLINRFGPSGPLTLGEAAGRPVTEVAFAFSAARGMLGLADLWARIDALDGSIAGTAQLELYERVRAALIIASTDLLRGGVAEAPLEGSIDRLSHSATAVGEMLAASPPAALAARIEAGCVALTGLGVPEHLARDVARLPALAETPSVLAVADASGAAIGQAARAFFGIEASLGIGDITARARDLAPADDYERLAIGGSIASLGDGVRSLAATYLKSGAPDPGHWLGAAGPLADLAHRELATIAGARDIGIARLAVASARVSSLAQSVGRMGR